MKEKLRSKAFQRFLLSLIALMLLMSFCVLTFIWKREIAESRKNAQRDNDAAIQSTMEYLDSTLNSIQLLAEEIRTTPWVVKLYAAADVFVDNYDYLHRQELIDDFLFYTGVNDRVAERFLFFPRRDICIAKQMWVSSRFYFGTVGVKAAHRDALIQTISELTELSQIDGYEGICFERNILIVTPIQHIRSPRAYLGTFLSREILSKEIANNFSSGIQSVRIVRTDTGTPVLEIGECEGEADAVFNLRYADWRCEFRVSETLANFDTEGMLRSMLVYLLILLMFSFVAAYFLASFLYRPLRKLVGKLDFLPHAMQERSLDEYERIGSSIDMMKRRFEESRRVTLYRRALMGDLNDYDVKGVAFLQATCFQVLLVVRLDDKGMTYDDVAVLRKLINSHPGLSCELIELERDELAVIAAYESQADGEYLSEQLIEMLREKENLSVFAGDVVSGWHGIGTSCQQARRKLRYLNGFSDVHYYFPLDWENRLIADLRVANMAQALEILKELRRQNENRMDTGMMDENDFWQLGAHLLSDIRRVYEENGLDDMIRPNGGESSQDFWQGLEQNCQRLCDLLEERSIRKGGVAQQVVDYINQHCFDMNISLASVKEAFGLSDKTIGKYVQSVTGEKFLNYLIKLRMDEAKRLLVEEHMKTAQVAVQIGYGSDFSFQRAFYRYTGMKVQDFVDSQ